MNFPPPLPLSEEAIRKLRNQLEPQAFLSTDVYATAQQILLWFRQRWQVEVTFEEVRAHLGVETQRQWSDLAILRTTPALLCSQLLFYWHITCNRRLVSRCLNQLGITKSYPRSLMR